MALFTIPTPLHTSELSRPHGVTPPRHARSLPSSPSIHSLIRLVLASAVDVWQMEIQLVHSEARLLPLRPHVKFSTALYCTRNPLPKAEGRHKPVLHLDPYPDCARSSSQMVCILHPPPRKPVLQPVRRSRRGRSRLGGGSLILGAATASSP